jgi:hypothetical protein
VALFSNNGNSNNSNQNNNRREPVYYSGLRIRNYQDNTAIAISYSSGLMQIGIAKPDENNRFQNEISASVTPKKAAIIVDQLAHFEAGEEGVFGTVLGLGEVQTAIGFQMIDDKKYLRIAKVSKDGTINDQRTFAFPQNADPAYHWSDFDNMKFIRSYNDEIDYNMLKNALIDFARNMSGAGAYGGLYMNRYQEAFANSRITAICTKLGVNISNNNGSGNRNSGGGFFSNNGNSSNATSQHRSYEEISSMIDDDE